MVGDACCPRATGGLAARTELAVVASANDWAGGEAASLVIAQPEQGRTHQVRLHCACGGAPLAGDSLYGGKVRRADRTARFIKATAT